MRDTSDRICCGYDKGATFDPAKCARNKKAHGLPFDLANDFDWSTALVVEDTRQHYNERRVQALGMIEAQLHMLVFTPRAGSVHVISLRRANAARGAAMRRKPNPELIDDDAPEANDEWFADARPARAVLPELFRESTSNELLRPKRGRPPSSSPKEHVNIRLDADVLSAFRSKGSGWQTRMNQALRDWVRTHE